LLLTPKAPDETKLATDKGEPKTTSRISGSEAAKAEDSRADGIGVKDFLYGTTACERHNSHGMPTPGELDRKPSSLRLCATQAERSEHDENPQNVVPRRAAQPTISLHVGSVA
jgi:hypothetical protein